MQQEERTSLLAVPMSSGKSRELSGCRSSSALGIAERPANATSEPSAAEDGEDRERQVQGLSGGARGIGNDIRRDEKHRLVVSVSSHRTIGQPSRALVLCAEYRRWHRARHRLPWGVGPLPSPSQVLLAMTCWRRAAA